MSLSWWDDTGGIPGWGLVGSGLTTPSWGLVLVLVSSITDGERERGMEGRRKEGEDLFLETNVCTTVAKGQPTPPLAE